MPQPEQLTKTIVPKLWGYEEWLVNNDLYCGKMLHIRPGFKCSLHYHNAKDETFVCVEGSVKLEYKGVDGTTRLTTLHGDERNAVRLRPGTPHRFWALYDEKAVVLEFSTQHDDADTVRLEDSFEIDPDPKDRRKKAGFAPHPAIPKDIKEKFEELVEAIGEEVDIEFVEEEDD